MERAESAVYGASDHYLGDKGEAYFAWQSGAGLFGGRINAHKFAHLIKPSDIVIDFGCGGGFLLRNLTCAHRVGIEINPAGRRHAVELGVECFADTSQVPDGIADVVLSDHALEHVPFPIGALRELRHKLKPEGIVALCVPIDNWRHQKRYDANDANHHLHTWTPQLLGNSLAEAGYDVLSVYARNFAWPGRWTVAAYGRLPFTLFRTICYVYSILSGKGWEVLAVARPVRTSRGEPAIAD